MIEFYSETEFELTNGAEVEKWISSVISSEGFEEGDITYVFCSDEYLHKLNLQFLNHDTLTDVISFDNSLGKQVHGEIYISIDRVRENASEFGAVIMDELHRVMVHGVLHFCGYKDKTSDEEKRMRLKEDEALNARIFV